MCVCLMSQSDLFNKSQHVPSLCDVIVFYCMHAMLFCDDVIMMYGQSVSPCA